MKGVILILGITTYVTLRALSAPWVGIVGYGTFAVLCPPWNWRWSLPSLDYQKFLAISTLLGFLFTGMRRNPLRGNVALAMCGLWGFLLLSLLSLTQSINPPKSWIFIDIIFKIILMSSLAVFILSTSRQIWIFVVCLIAAQGWNAFNINQIYFERGFIQVNYFQWNYLDNNTYCISSVPVLAFSIGMALCATKTWHRIAAGVVVILQIHQLMLLQSRGTMLGALLLAGLAIVFMPKTAKTIKTVVVTLVLSAILAGPPVVKEFMSSFEEEGARDSSAESRFKLWEAGANITQDFPLLGVGPWAGERLIPQYYDGHLDVSVKAPHNLLFEVSTGMGVPATVLYLAFFWLVWWEHFKLWRRKQDWPEWFLIVQVGILAGIPGYWAASMFSSGALIEAPYLMVAIGAVSLVVFHKESAMMREWLISSQSFDESGAATNAA